MPFYRCEIRRQDGSVIAQDVMITIEETTRDGAPRWYGTMTVTHLSELTAGERYLLTLTDGRSGEFRVRRNTFAGGVERAVAIDGAGPLG